LKSLSVDIKFIYLTIYDIISKIKKWRNFYELFYEN
jgi:hypothetical protein